MKRNLPKFRLVESLILIAVVAITPLPVRVEAAEKNAAHHHELISAEEALHKQMTSGEVEAGRNGYRALVEERLAASKASSGAKTAAAASQSNLKARLAAAALNAWEKSELVVRDRGEIPADEVYESLLKHARELCALVKTLEKNTATTLGRNVPVLKEMTATKRMTTTAAKGVLALTRESGLQPLREALFQEAKAFLPGVSTLAQFDATNRDVYKILNVQREQSVTRLRSSAVRPNPERKLTEQETTALTALVKAIYDSLFANQYEELRKSFAADYWPEEKLRELGAKTRGWAISRVGSVKGEKLDTEEIEVSVEQMVLIDSTGREIRSRDQFVVRPVQQGFEVVFFGSRRERTQGH